MKPILFNTEMVRAILDGRKTVTRRVIQPQPDKEHSHELGYVVCGYAKDIGSFGFGTHECGGDIQYVKPPYQINDILYVREAWVDWCCEECDWDCEPDNNFSGVCCSAPKYLYKASDETQDKGWRPSIHMPKEAARIFLKVTGVRVERLQDITEEQAKAEGVKHPYSYAENDDYWETTGRNELSADVAAFSALWDSTVHKSNIDHYGWDANPYVWVIEFEVIDKAAAFKEG